MKRTIITAFSALTLLASVALGEDIKKWKFESGQLTLHKGNYQGDGETLALSWSSGPLSLQFGRYMDIENLGKLFELMAKVEDWTAFRNERIEGPWDDWRFTFAQKGVTWVNGTWSIHLDWKIVSEMAKAIRTTIETLSREAEPPIPKSKKAQQDGGGQPATRSELD